MKLLNILLLCNHTYPAACVQDHIRAITKHSGHNCVLFNPSMQEKVRFDPRRFDIVVIHYSLWVEHSHVLSPEWRAAIAAFDGPKAQFLHDEYRNVRAIKNSIRDLGINCVFSVVPESKLRNFYGDLEEVRLESILTGYVPERMLGIPCPTMAQRGIDIGYRGRTYPYSLGRLAYEKEIIGKLVLAEAAKRGSNLRCDISSAEEDRIYGTRWDSFLLNCRAVLGTESGASVIDWDGSIGPMVAQYIIEHPLAGFDEVSANVLGDQDGKLVLNTVAPKHFEAAAFRTLQVQFPGDYSGIMEAWKHYVPLEKDLSNFDEVAAVVLDDKRAGEIAQRAYDDLVASRKYSNESFGKWCGSTLGELWHDASPEFRSRPRVPYSAAAVRLRSFSLLPYRAKFLGGLIRGFPRIFATLRTLRMKFRAGQQNFIAGLWYVGYYIPIVFGPIAVYGTRELRGLSLSGISSVISRGPNNRPAMAQIVCDYQWLLFVERQGLRVLDNGSIVMFQNCGQKLRIHIFLGACAFEKPRAVDSEYYSSESWRQLLNDIRVGCGPEITIRICSDAAVPIALTEGPRKQHACEKWLEKSVHMAERRIGAVAALFNEKSLN